MHIYHKGKVKHYNHFKAFFKYRTKKIFFINVNNKYKFLIKFLYSWIDISKKINNLSFYENMGIDRKALCLSHKNGIFISVGTAITIDIMENKIYKGGVILLGLKAQIEAYKKISSSLHTTLDKKNIKKELAFNTKDSINFGIIQPILAYVEKIILENQDKQLYFTGGDGLFISSFFKNSIFDELLIFKGILSTFKENK